jgi:hypothetical protein
MRCLNGINVAYTFVPKVCNIGKSRGFWTFRSAAFLNRWRELFGASAMPIVGDHYAI